MKHTGARIITTLLERQGVTTVAGIPGGATLPLYDALHSSGIRHVLARHEQGAGFIAQGMARATGKAAVCIVTSGPGTTNLLTAIADAKLDSIPLIAITGQVPTSLIGTDAFQEVDTYGLTLPITKHNFSARNATELLEIIPRAFQIAESGRPGPVVVDVPKDVQLQTVEFDAWPEPYVPLKPNDCEPAAIERLAEMINRAKRPILYIGGGIVASGSSGLLRNLARKNSIPVTSTLMGLGAFPADDPLSLGMLGMHGARYTNYALEEADVILAFGVRFDDRATGKVDHFCPDALIAHIDIDHSEIDKIKTSHLSLVSDAGEVLQRLIPLVDENPREEWNGRIAQLKTEFPFNMPDTCNPLHPLNIITALSKWLEPDDIIATDVGQHQMWVAQVYPFRSPRTLMTSGGLGTMGFGFPTAIGASLARPDKRIVCISGDGSFLMNCQELATLANLNLNVTVIIMNNRHLGLVRQQQELFYGERYHAVRLDTLPDFAALARSFGLRAHNLADAADPSALLYDAITDPAPCVIDAPIRAEENVFPMVPPGAANKDTIGGEVHV